MTGPSLLSAFGKDSQHGRLLRIDFPQGDGPKAILLVNDRQPGTPVV